jgi:hypothetical protein
MPTTITRTFNYTGATQTITLPWNITSNVRITCTGASGETVGGQTGGEGGTMVYDIGPTVGGETWYINVGGQGSGAIGGWNGGGDGNDTSVTFHGGGGGGSSDVRRGGSTLADRLVVGAGGGGSTSGWNGGDGGASTGADGEGYVTGSGGGGGDQNGGGTGGINAGGASSSGADGTLGNGGNGGRASTTNYSNGGGGGGGFYGGGGGGAYGLNHRGGGGGGGSNYGYVPPFHSGFSGTPIVSQTSGGNVGPGVVTIVYTVADPVTGSLAFSGKGSMSVSGVETRAQLSAMKASTSMSITSPLVARVGAIPIHVTANMTVPSSPIGLSPSLALRAQSTMSILNGLVQRFAATAFAAHAQLVLQETLSSVGFSAIAQMLVSSTTNKSGAVSISSLATMSLAGSDGHFAGIPVLVSSSLTIGPTHLVVIPPLSMAAQAAVSLAGTRSVPGAPFMSASTSLTLSAILIRFAGGIFTASTYLNLTPAIGHPSELIMFATPQMTIAGLDLELVAPLMSAYATMFMINPFTSNVLAIFVNASLIYLAPPEAFDAPYLIVTGSPADMAFFVSSDPGPGSVRNRLTAGI